MEQENISEETLQSEENIVTEETVSSKSSPKIGVYILLTIVIIGVIAAVLLLTLFSSTTPTPDTSEETVEDISIAPEKEYTALEDSIEVEKGFSFEDFAEGDIYGGMKVLSVTELLNEEYRWDPFVEVVFEGRTTFTGILSTGPDGRKYVSVDLYDYEDMEQTHFFTRPLFWKGEFLVENSDVLSGISDGTKYITIDRFVHKNRNHVGDEHYENTIFTDTARIIGVEPLPNRAYSYHAGISSEFYRDDDTVYFYDTQNEIMRIPHPLPDADPETFRYLSRFAGFDDQKFHYFEYDSEIEDFVAYSIDIPEPLVRLFDVVDQSNDLKNHILKLKAEDISPGEITFEEFTEISSELRRSVFSLKDENNNIVAYGLLPAFSKILRVDDRLVFFTAEGVFLKELSADLEKIIDVKDHQTTFKPGATKFYYTKSYEDLDLIEYDIRQKTERSIEHQFNGSITGSSRITLTPDEQHLLVRVTGDFNGRNILLIDIDTGETEEVASEVTGRGGNFPFATSPNNDKVFLITIPYEGYLFDTLHYYEKDPLTGVWDPELKELGSVHLEVGGGWNIEMGQWSLSPSGKYLALADSSEQSVSGCYGMIGTPEAHNVLKYVNLNTLKVITLAIGASLDDFSVHQWSPDERGFYATKTTLSKEDGKECIVDFAVDGEREYFEIN